MNVKTDYKYLCFLLMLYMTIKLTTIILIYKVITIGPFTASASTIIIPFWFVIGDLITEVYGYKFARNAIWMAILCQFIFAGLCLLSLNFDSPPGWVGQEAYQQILGKLHLVTIASFLAIISGAFLNAYALSKWKVLLRGRYFWLRSLGSSIVGELIFTIVAYSIEFLGTVPVSKIIELMIVSFITKLIFTPICVFPSMYVAAFLKRSEMIDAYDEGINYNPFCFELSRKIETQEEGI